MKKKKPVKQQTAARKSPSPILKSTAPEKGKIYGALAAILIISLVVYLPVFNNTLLAWDDNAYIKDNPLVHSINLPDIFSKYVMGNYHPLTMLVHAIEYKFFGLDPAGYHAVNLLLHLLNTLLVFYAIFLISNKNSVALVAALLFGIHPLHVESVAWAAELKDLLYTFFFLASWIFYMKYLEGFQKKYILIALLLFLLSLLSKAMAASLPVVLLLTDYFKGRKINARSLLEKVPFFFLAIALGVVAVLAQKSSNAIQDITNYSFLNRIIFASYGFMSYLFKAVLPVNLSSYYPYPALKGGNVPAQYYAYLPLFLTLVAFVFYSLRKTGKIFFGMGFFAVTVFLVLQLLPVGGAIMADRYSYIPSIGVFYLAGEGVNYIWNRNNKPVSVILLIVFTVFFSVKTFSNVSVWKDDLTLWNNVIRQYPAISFAYYNRGVAYMKDKNFQAAMDDYNKAIQLNAKYTNAYFNRGKLYLDENRFDEAFKDFNKAIELKPDNADAYYSRGVVYFNKKRFEESVKEYSKAIELKPDFADAYYTRANSFRDLKKYEESRRDYNKAIELKPDYAMAWFNRGVLSTYEKRNADAIADLSKAISIDPVYANAYVNRGNVYNDEKKYEEAIADYSKAIELNPNLAAAYFNRGQAENNAGKKDAACADVKKAASMGLQFSPVIIQQFCQ